MKSGDEFLSRNRANSPPVLFSFLEFDHVSPGWRSQGFWDRLDQGGGARSKRQRIIAQVLANKANQICTGVRNQVTE